MFKKIDPKKTFPEMEREVLDFWIENSIFEKSIENRRDCERYSFYDGPPFATGTPHYGHLVASTMKDVVPRFWTMKGKLVERKWGWDCHGLPIENIVEKELGSKSKKDVEDIGVEKFNEICRTKVLEYANVWEKVIKRLGRWADMENPYKTMDLSYMESVWWVFKQLWDKGLIYEGHRSMHVCPRCETTLSQSEVAEGYATIKDLSVVGKFKLKDEDNTYFLAWTTTPWTLISNVALAVGKDIDYAYVETVEADKEKGFKDEIFIVAKDKVAEVMGDRKHQILRVVKGESLIGKKYEPLFDYYSKNEKLENYDNGWKVYTADFVTTQEGTGIVHIAPGFGEDDLNLGEEMDLPFVQHISMDGVIKKEIDGFAGLNVKGIEDHQATDVEIIRNLAKKELLFSKEKYEHSYPHCWRCDTPLINFATTSWFVDIKKIKPQALDYAKKINWVPAHMKEGRFGKWLENAKDWSISRQRFWASVMPIWKCSCGELKVFGSVSELEEVSGQKIEDIHKHVVDKVTFKCEKCGKEMKRIPDVLDTWFDSGSMPFAQMHYPFENKEDFENGFPAEFIAEGVDQTRAWFYYLHVISSAIKETNSFNNVIVNGIVLAEDGKKMSKKLQNYPDPMEMFEKYGSDSVRFYLMSSPVVSAQNINFSEREVSEVVRGMMRMLWNSYSFFVLYANIDGWKKDDKKLNSDNLLDKWIMSELQMLIKNFESEMENYELSKAARLIPPFVDNLSNWFVRRSRKRFWKSENDEDKNYAYSILHEVLIRLSQVIAPFTPFIAEEIYRNLEQDQSVHLSDFPKFDPSLMDDNLNKEMEEVRSMISEGLQMRAQQKVRVRQPLAKASIKNSAIREDLLEVIAEELNVKKVDVDKGQENSIVLDFEITPQLKMEGMAREVIRFIQELRKKADYKVDDRIDVSVIGLDEVLDSFEKMISNEVLANKISRTDLSGPDMEKEFELEGGKVKIQIKK